MKLAGWSRAVVLAASGLFASGCLQRIAVDAQIGAIRRAGGSMNTMHDFDVAKASAYSGLSQLEGLYVLAPHNDDIIRLLNAGWGSATFGFTLDDLEKSMIGQDDEEFEFQKARARAGFARAKFYGEELLSRRAEGFAEAKRNAATIRRWLVDNFDEPEDAEDLLWVAFAWMTHVAASMDVPEVVAELYVGVAIAERVVELDETVGHGTVHVILGLYYSHSGEQDLKAARRHFERGIALGKGKYLPPLLSMATGYYCAAGMEKEYLDTLREVLQIGKEDPLPSARLPNLLTMRRASLYLRHDVFRESCAFDQPPEPKGKRKVSQLGAAIPELIFETLPRLARADAPARVPPLVAPIASHGL